MDETPLLVSGVEGLHPRHPFRLIFEQTRKNLAHVGISLDAESNITLGTNFFVVPGCEGEISVTMPYQSHEQNYVSVVFEIEASKYKIAYTLSLGGNDIKLLYSLHEDKHNRTYGDFSGKNTWYKNGVVRDETVKADRLQSGEFVEVLREIIEKLEADFRIAQPDANLV